MKQASRRAPAALILPLFICLFVVSIFFPQFVFAATTDTISFQSKLVNTDGTNIPNDTYNFRFLLYTVSTGGTAVWSEDRSLTVTDGILSVELGSVTPFGSTVFDNADLYLQVCFDANGNTGDSSDTNCSPATHRYEEVFSTRKPITAVPVALRAQALTDGAGNAFTHNSFFKQGGNEFGAPGVLGTLDAYGLSFLTDSIARMVITSSGNVGIGTTTPTDQLTLADTVGPVVFGTTLLGNPGTNTIFGTHVFRAQNVSTPNWQTSYATPFEDVLAFAYDSVNGVMYATTAWDPVILRCPMSSGCDSSGDWAEVYEASNPDNSIRSIVFDPTSGLLFALGEQNIFRCDTTTGCDIPGEWTSVYSVGDDDGQRLVVDTNNSVLYIGTDNATLKYVHRCDIAATGCDASGDFTVTAPYDISGISGIVSFAFDATNSVLYAGTIYSARVYRCETSTGCDQDTDWTLSVDLPNANATAIGVDTDNDVLYAATENDLYRCDTATNCDAGGDWNLVYSDMSDWIYALAYDPVHGRMYAATGDVGHIYVCSVSTGCDASGEWTLSYDASANEIVSLGIDTDTGVVFAGSYYGPGDGNIYYYNDSAPPSYADYAAMSALAIDPSAGSEDGQLLFSTLVNGENKHMASLDGSGLGVFGNLKILEGGSSPEYFTIFQGGDQSATITYTLPTASANGVLTNTGGVLSWETAGGGCVACFEQDGNAFGAVGVLGTTDNFALEFITNDTLAMILSETGRLGIGVSSPRATLDVQAKPFEVIGTELVTNGTFTGGLTGWDTNGGTTYGSNNVILTTTDGGGNSELWQEGYTIVQGKYYRLQFTLSGVSTVDAILQIELVNLELVSTSFVNSFDSNGTYEVILFAREDGTNGGVYFGTNNPSTENSTFTLDDVSFREITFPGAFLARDSSGEVIFSAGGGYDYANVGIGTEVPEAKLHIVHNTDTSWGTGLRIDSYGLDKIEEEYQGMIVDIYRENIEDQGYYNGIRAHVEAYGNGLAYSNYLSGDAAVFSLYLGYADYVNGFGIVSSVSAGNVGVANLTGQETVVEMFQDAEESLNFIGLNVETNYYGAQPTGSSEVYGIMIGHGSYGTMNVDYLYGLYISNYEDAASGDSFALYSEGGTNYFGGNVGIGVYAPQQTLSIAGNFGILEGGTSPEFFTIFQGGDQSGNITYTLPTTSVNGVLTNTGGVLSWETVTSCAACFEQDGNAFGEPGVLGTTDNYALSFITNNIERLSIGTSGVISMTSSLLPSANDTYDLGSDSYRFRDLYLGGESIYIGTSATDQGIISYNTTANIFNFSTDSTSNGDIAFFTNVLYLDKSESRVGIGTATPGQTLSVSGTLGILEGGGSPEFYTVFQGGDQSGNITYTLPTESTDGVLVNTAGTLSWQDLTGNSILTASNASLANGSYLNIEHGFDTNDILAMGWIFSDSVWKQLDTTYTPAIAWEGRHATRESYYQAAQMYRQIAETGAYTSNLLDQGIFFDTFEDKTKTDSTVTTSVFSMQLLDPHRSLGGYREQTGRIGLWGNQTLNSSTTDTAGNNYLGTNVVTDSYYYELSEDSSPEVQVELGIDPNWNNGVVLLSSAGKNLSTTYNGSLIKAIGRYSSNPRPILITITSPFTFNWTDNNGNSASGVTITPGVSQVLGSTGVSIIFTGAQYMTGDVFQVASWFTEPTSSVRGSKQEFPDRSYIISTRDHVDIIDADTQKLWMRLSGTTTAVNMLPVTTLLKARTIEALNGNVYVGINEPTEVLGYFARIRFSMDDGYNHHSAGHTKYGGSIARRNAGLGFTSLSSEMPLAHDAVMDVSVAVIPNHPTKEVTISGWGYIQGAAATTISEQVLLPYTFVNIPTVSTVSVASRTTTAPRTLAECTGANQRITSIASSITNNSFTQRLSASDAADGNFSTTTFYCYTWTATGVVAPKQFIAVATGASGVDGGVTVVNETDSRSAHVFLGSHIGDTIWHSKVELTDNNSLYSAMSNSTANISRVEVYRNVHGLMTESSLALYRTGVYWVGASTSGWSLNGPTILGNATGVSQINALHVEEGSSLVDPGSNTLYVGTASGLTVIQENSGNSIATANDGGTEKFGSAKYYTTSNISEEMFGDIRGMWQMSGDLSGQGNTLTNESGPVTAVSGVRGEAGSYNGTNQAYYCTDASCGGTSKLDYTGSGAWAWGGWIQAKGGAGTSRVVMSKSFNVNASNNGGYITTLNSSNQILSQALNNSSGNAVTSKTTIALDTWYHVVTVYTGTRLNLYINGVLEDSVAYSSGIMDVTQSFYIGRHANAAVQYFNGYLDEIFVTATEISGADVRKMYETGSRALQSHGTTLGGGGADTNQQLGGTSNVIGDVAIDKQRQYMYVGTNHTSNGRVSKIQLNADTNIKTYGSSANVPTGGPVLVNQNTSSVLVGDHLELVASLTDGAIIIGPDNQTTLNSAVYESKMYELPKNIASAVVWVKGVTDADDSGNTITVKASVDDGSTFATCTVVSTNAEVYPPETEYSCIFSASGNELKMRFEFARTNAKTSTFVTQYGVSWLGQSGFRIEQLDANNVRLYNYSGITQNVRLNAIGTGVVGGGGGGECTDCYELGGNAFGETGVLGTTDNYGLSFITNNTEKMSITAGGNVGIGTTASNFKLEVAGHIGPSANNTYDLGSDAYRFRDLYLGGDTIYIGASSSDQGMISYDAENNVLRFDTDSTSNGSISFLNDLLFLDKTSGRVSFGASSGDAKLVIDSTVSAYGSELVTNGTFTGSATGWTLADSATYGSNAVTIAYDEGLHEDWPEISTSIVTEIGKIYKIEFTISGIANDGMYWWSNGGNDGAEVPVTGNGTVVKYFKAKLSGSHTVTFGLWNGITGGTFTIDDVSVVEVLNAQPAFALYDLKGDSLIGLGDDFSKNVFIGYSSLSNNSSADVYRNVVIGIENLSNAIQASQNIAIGNYVLANSQTSSGNIGIGNYALAESNDADNNIAIGNSAMAVSGGGNYNIALGYNALYKNDNWENIAIGGWALYENVDGSGNVAIGANSLQSNVSGTLNTGVGHYTLIANTGEFNTAVGAQVLMANTTGSENTAVGISALYSNETGYNNTALGSFALDGNVDGFFNTAVGSSALSGNETGYNNTALGVQSLLSNRYGLQNTALGMNALYSLDPANDLNGNNNVAVGFAAGYDVSTGSGNVLLGYRAGDNITTGSRNIVIGTDINAVSLTESNTLNIGNMIYGRGLDGTGDTLSNGRVGVGIAEPRATLEVYGASVRTLTGSIDPIASTAVTGVGTRFLAEVSVGDRIVVSGEIRTVVSIASDTSLTVDFAFSDNGNDTAVEVYTNTLAVTGSSAFYGGASFMGLQTPAAPSVGGTSSGAATWRYRVSAVNAHGNETILSAEGTRTSAPATLTGANYNTITWTAVPGAVGYRIFRTTAATSPNTTGFIGYVEATQPLTFDDTGITVTGSYSSTTFNESSNVSIGTSAAKPPLDTLSVDGRINQSWHYFFTDFIGSRANVTANTANWWEGLRLGIKSACTASFVSGAVNGVVQLQTGATSGNACLIDFNNVNQISTAYNPVFETEVNLPSAATSVVYVGFMQRTVSTGAVPTSGAYFLSTNGGAWQAVSRTDASNATTTNTGVTPATGLPMNILRVETTATSARFFIDGRLVADHSTDLPPTTVVHEFEISIVTNEAVLKQLRVDSIEIWQDDPPADAELPESVLEEMENPIIEIFDDPVRFTETMYMAGGSEAEIEDGLLVSYSGATQLGVDERNRVIHALTAAAQANKNTFLGVATGPEAQRTPYDETGNPYLVATFGPSYAWIEEGSGGNVVVGDLLSISSTLPGYAQKDGSGVVAVAQEAIDWSTVTDTVGGKKVKKVLIFVKNGAAETAIATAGTVSAGWNQVTDTTIQSTHGIIVPNVTATTAEINVLRTRTLAVNDLFFVDDEGNMTTSGTVLASVISTPTIKGIGGAVTITLEGSDRFAITVDGETALEASVEGVKVNNLIVSDQQAGRVIIDAGETEFTVESLLVTEESIVVVTPNKAVVVAVEPFEGGFVLRLAAPQSEGVSVGWYVVNVSE